MSREEQQRRHDRALPALQELWRRTDALHAAIPAHPDRINRGEGPGRAGAPAKGGT